MSKSILLSLVCLAVSAYFAPCRAQNSQQDYLDGHNNARCAVGVANITWSATLAAYAQNYVSSRLSDCSLVHSGGTYGENLAKGSGAFTVKAAVGLWVAEKSKYVYSSNSCVGGECRHYTQVVWGNSVSLGCARLQCANGWWYVSCNYSPRGNIIGQTPY